MSDESRPGEAAVPSFGDLFDDPEPYHEPAARPATAPAADAAPPAGDAPSPAAPAAAAPVTPRAPSLDDTPVPDWGDDVADPSLAFVPPLVHEPSPVAPAAPHPAPLPEPVLDAGPVLASAGAAAGAAIASGRLYRSAGAEGPATLDAIPAIDPEVLASIEAARGVPHADARPAAATAGPAVAQGGAAAPAAQGGTGLTWTGVVVVVVAATVLVGFADALINNSLGLITGIALAVSSVYCAVTVRRSDIWAAVVVPPLAFLAAALTAGQLTLDSSGSLVIREGYMLLKTLAQNAPFILGTALVCLVIVLVRRHRGSHA